MRKEKNRRKNRKRKRKRKKKKVPMKKIKKKKMKKVKKRVKKKIKVIVINKRIIRKKIRRKKKKKLKIKKIKPKKEEKEEKESVEEKKEKESTEEKKVINNETKEKINLQEKQEIKEEKRTEAKEETKETEGQEKRDETNYKEEYMKLKNLITEYEQGNILAEKTKNDIDIIKSESLSKIKELRAKLEELTSINLTKLKEYESIISTTNIELSQKNKSIQEYEIITLKQEDKIEQLNTQIYELNKAMFHKNLSMKENETYSNQLIDLIHEHKLQIKQMQEKKIDDENVEISLLKRENKNLKNELEIEQRMMQNMKEYHQNLQRKYLNISYNNRKKEQEAILKQAEFLAKDKLNKININNRYKLFTMNRSSSLGLLREKQLRQIKNKNKVNNVRLKNEDSNLPKITYGNKSCENENLVKLTTKKTKRKVIEDDLTSNMDEINEKLKKIIEEN